MDTNSINGKDINVSVGVNIDNDAQSVNKLRKVDSAYRELTQSIYNLVKAGISETSNSKKSEDQYKKLDKAIENLTKQQIGLANATFKANTALDGNNVRQIKSISATGQLKTKNGELVTVTQQLYKNQDLANNRWGTGIPIIDKLNKQLNSLRWSMVNFTFATAAIGAFISPFVALTKQGMAWELQLKKIQAVSGQAFTSPKTMGDLSNKLVSARMNTPFTNVQVGGAFEEFIKAGFDAKTATESIVPITNLATAGYMDLNDAAMLTAQTMHEFATEGMTAVQATDLIYKASVKSAMSAETFGNALSYVGPIASQLGYTAKETSAALVVLSNAGLSGSKAGTTLRQVMASIAEPSAQAQKWIDALGMSFYNANGSSKTLEESLAVLYSSLEALDPERRAKAINEMFNIRGAAGVSALMNALKQGLNLGDVARGFDDVNSASEAAAVQMEASVNKLKNALEDLKSSFLPAATEINNAFSKILTAVSSVTKKMNEEGLGGAVALGGVGAVGAGGIAAYKYIQRGSSPATPLFVQDVSAMGKTKLAALNDNKIIPAGLVAGLTDAAIMAGTAVATAAMVSWMSREDQKRSYEKAKSEGKSGEQKTFLDMFEAFSLEKPKWLEDYQKWVEKILGPENLTIAGINFSPIYVPPPEEPVKPLVNIPNILGKESAYEPGTLQGYLNPMTVKTKRGAPYKPEYTPEELSSANDQYSKSLDKLVEMNSKLVPSLHPTADKISNMIFGSGKNDLDAIATQLELILQKKDMLDMGDINIGTESFSNATSAMEGFSKQMTFYTDNISNAEYIINELQFGEADNSLKSLTATISDQQDKIDASSAALDKWKTKLSETEAEISKLSNQRFNLETPFSRVIQAQEQVIKKQKLQALGITDVENFITNAVNKTGNAYDGVVDSINNVNSASASSQDQFKAWQDTVREHIRALVLEGNDLTKSTTDAVTKHQTMLLSVTKTSGTSNGASESEKQLERLKLAQDYYYGNMHDQVNLAIQDQEDIQNGVASNSDVIISSLQKQWLIRTDLTKKLKDEENNYNNLKSALDILQKEYADTQKKIETEKNTIESENKSIQSQISLWETNLRKKQDYYNGKSSGGGSSSSGGSTVSGYDKNGNPVSATSPHKPETKKEIVKEPVKAPETGYKKYMSSSYFAEGGVVTKPTSAIIGEAGPEAIIPLSELKQYYNSMFGSGNNDSGATISIGNINISGVSGNASDFAYEFSKELRKQLKTI